MNKGFNFHELKLTNRLPSPSGTALAVVRLMQNENTSVREVARLIQTDPALSGRVLRVANSASTGLHRPIVDVQSAALVTGMQILRNLSLSFSLVDNYQQGKCQSFNYSHFWAESLASAVALSSISLMERVVAPEEAFTFGLLSDIGRLAMASVWPDDYYDCLSPVDEKYLIAFEKEKFSIDHKTLGAMLLEDWGIPRLFLDAISYCSQLKYESSDRVVRLAFQINFARQLAKFLMTNQEADDDLPPDLLGIAGLHGYESSDLPKLIDTIRQDWHDWGKLIDIKINSKPRRESEKQSVEPPTFAEETTTQQRLKLLLIDDDSFVLEALSSQLIHAGFDVATCVDSEAAMQYVMNHKPHIVVTDNNLLPRSGVDFCKALRSFDFGKSCYIIMLTANDDETTLLESFDAGIDDYLTKPVNFRIFLARLRAGQRIVSMQYALSRKYEEIEQSSVELSVVNRQLLLQANTDSLTALPNRRYAQARFEQECGTPRSSNQTFSMLMLDLDHFKSINDNLGHDAGDKVLAHAAKVIRETVRSGDIACRWGGEEFLIIAANTDFKTAKFIAERLRSAIEKNQCPDIRLSRPVTVSIGGAVTMGKNADWFKMLKQADEALYRVKQNGRNAVHFSS